MRIVRLVLAFSLAWVLSLQAFSQIALRATLASGQTIPTSVDIGTSFSFNLKVVNDSTSSFVGNLNLSYRINSLIYTTSDSSSGLQYTIQQDSIGPGDSAIRNIIVHVTNPKFIIGPSVVVIWPVAQGTYASDSLAFMLDVNDTATGIHIPDEEYLRCLVQWNSLCISKAVGIQLKRVRIFTAMGQLIQEQKNPEERIPLSNYESGTYLAEILYNNNQRKIFRFILR